MDSSLALFCLLHPSTKEKKERILSLLSSARPYYTSPASKCTTWTYFLPSTRPNSTQDLVTNNNRTNDTLIGGLEIYTDKSALSIQLDSDMFKDFQSKTKNEQLYDKDEELTAWYPTHGFTVRDTNQGNDDTGATLLFDERKTEVQVTTTKFVCVQGHRDRVLDELSKHAEQIKQTEPRCLTYCVLTRPKSPDEILIVERFDGESIRHEYLTKTIKDHVIESSIEVQEWMELSNAFVGSSVDRTKLDLSSKL